MAAPSFLPSPVTAGHPPFQLSWLGARTPLESLSFLCNTQLSLLCSHDSELQHKCPPSCGTWQGKCWSCQGDGKVPAGTPAHTPGDPSLAREFSPGTGVLRGHFSHGSAASHQHGGSTLLVEQVHAVLEVLKLMHLSLHVYTHQRIVSQTKHYKCAAKK